MEISFDEPQTRKEFNISQDQRLLDALLNTPSEEMTYKKRQDTFGKVAGGGGTGELERIQILNVTNVTGVLCAKTTERFNWMKSTLEKAIRTPCEKCNYTENFDGKFEFGDIKYLTNYKFVCGQGGSQTRSLRECCYKFIFYQYKFLNKNGNRKFINIIDGDGYHKLKNCFAYLESKYPQFKNYVYIGNSAGFENWWKAINNLV